MALDTNIALGIKPVEQPNMLAQMGQMMQLRQAQQGFESENALRDFYAQGGDLSTAEGKRQLMSRAPGAGMKLIGQQSEISARDINTAEKSLAMLKNQAGLVKTPEDAANWLSSFYKNPLTRPYVESIAPMDKALAAIPTDPAALQGWLRNASLKADQIFESADAQLNARTRIQAANIGAVAGNRQASIAEQRFAIEKAQQAEIDALFGKPPSSAPAVAPMGGGGVPNALPAVVGAAPAAPAPTNMLVPGAQAPATAGVPAAAPVVAAQPSDIFAEIRALDAKIAPLVNTGNPRASAIVQQLIAQRNALMQSAKQMYGGQETTMEVIDPTTGQPVTIKARPDERGVLQPVKRGEVPLSVNATAGSDLTISPNVARPAPTPAVVKERQAASKLPEAIAMNNDAIRKIDEMIGGVDANGKPLPGAKGKPHPGFNEAVGAGFGTAYIPGTQGKSFTIRHKEVLSQAFLDAFEALKGGGAITEKEGEKATAARTRMDLAQSETEYMAAAREYQGVLKRGVENARARIQRSGGTAPTTATPETSAAPVVKTEAEYNALPSGSTYVDPDGVTRRKR
jgi:hypothetical protein